MKMSASIAKQFGHCSKSMHISIDGGRSDEIERERGEFVAVGFEVELAINDVCNSLCGVLFPREMV